MFLERRVQEVRSSRRQNSTSGTSARCSWTFIHLQREQGERENGERRNATKQKIYLLSFSIGTN